MDFPLNVSDYLEENLVFSDDSFLDGSSQIQPDVAENSSHYHGDGLASEEPGAHINPDSNDGAGNMSNDANNNTNHDITKGQWTLEEDKKLIDLMKKHGEKWSKIAAEFKTRSGKQCRERWIYHHRPDIKEIKWSEEEDKILIEAHRELGNKWSTIAKRLPGRTDNAIKNHFNKTRRKNLAKRSSCRSRPKTALQEYIASIPDYNMPVISPARITNPCDIEPFACPDQNMADGANDGTCTSSHIPDPGCTDLGMNNRVSLSTFTQDASSSAPNPSCSLGSFAPNPSCSGYTYQSTFMHGVNNSNSCLLQETNNAYRNELACVVEGFGGNNNTTTIVNPSASQINTNLGSGNHPNSTGYGYEDPYGDDDLASLIAGFGGGSSEPQYINEVMDANPNSNIGHSDKKGKAKVPDYLL